jgi:hypothetical protein
MKKTIFFLLLLTASAWLASLPACNKSEERLTTIQGRITEYGTGAPIEGARIYLLCYDGSVFGGSSSTLGDSIVTDANGEFHREYPQDDVCGGAYMIVWKEGYFKRDGLGVTTGVNNVNIALDPEAWLKVVTVPDGQNNYDHIGVGGDFSFEAWASEGIKTITFLARGNREIVVRWGPFNNPSIKFPDTLYVPGHDTTTYTIHY